MPTRAVRVPAISSPPSGAPWIPEVPALFGAPNPMTVRQRIRLGRLFGARLGNGLGHRGHVVPVNSKHCQPYDSKRAEVSSETARSVLPSIRPPLSSNSTINCRDPYGLPSRRPCG